MSVSKGKSAKSLVKRDPATGRIQKGSRPPGRPPGSKNKVNLIKLSLESGWRDRNYEKISQILDTVIEDALNGDKAARKLIWEASISKANISEDRDSSGNTPQILIRHMEVSRQGDIIDVTEVEEVDNESAEVERRG